MILPVLSPIWQEIAQNRVWSGLAFSARTVCHTVIPMAGASSKAPACTSDYCYPSPSRRFRSIGSGPFFSVNASKMVEQRAADMVRLKNLGDSRGDLFLLYLPVIKKIGGRKLCRSNIWPLLLFLSRRLPAVWTMTWSAPQPVRSRALLSRALWAAACLRVRLSGQALVRCATMLACATKLTNTLLNTLRSRTFSRTTILKTTIAGHVLRGGFLCFKGRQTVTAFAG